MSNPVLILGCGFTGRRVARSLLAAGRRVVATTRDPAGLADLAASGADVVRLVLEVPETVEAFSKRVPEDCLVLSSIPALRTEHGLTDPSPIVVEALAERPRRLVVLSTTGVYGDAPVVDESTPAAPVTERQRVRFQAEERARSGPWETLVLRPAAIYGPGRGLIERLRSGRHRLPGDGTNHVSRIHVEDLARISEAALTSGLTGAFPVADDEPVTSGEAVALAAELLGVEPPPSRPMEEVPETLRTSRRVDGRAIRRLLGVDLLYPSLRVGFPACL